jgi:superfamily II RNA helicase
VTLTLDRDALLATGRDGALEQFLAWTAERGFSLYPAQEEAILEAFAGNHVVVNTPTGSGKSLVALGAHVASMSAGERSFYTAPVKALVSEKFFALCRDLGAANVGMLTGDASINPTAPVVCATAEIVANMALRSGADAPIGQVVMDEFHFYGDPDRGWAWQVPLLELTRAQFVLMSATLGDTRSIEAGLRRRSGREVAVVRSATRPVPLSFEYRRTPLHETVESLLAADRAPLYIVYFTQAQALTEAQALTSAQVTTRAQREAIAAEIAGFRFAPGFGRTLSRLVHHGIGVHHGGMLPKYRRLVERLTQQGLLRVVVGTDTLGVGVNLPLRTVVFSGLSKYDGTTSRLLSAREFHQIAGRAGRAGFDERGFVVVQAPEHVVENEQAVRKAGNDPGKLRRIVKSKPPKGFVAWDENVYERIVGSQPEPLAGHLRVDHATLLNVLDRPGNGCAAMARLLTDNDEPRAVQRRLIRRAIAIYRSLLAAGALERLSEPDELGRMVRVTAELQQDFALDNPLSPFVLEAVPRLDAASETFALDVVSVVESTLGDPWPILSAQLDRLKTETLTELKAAGVEYEERMEALDKLEYPKPLREFIYQLFDHYRLVNPWVAGDNISPKSVARDLYEQAMTFSEYVAHYGINRSEGLLLRYLSEAWRGLQRAVPEDVKTEELLDLTEWLGELVRQVDSSLIDEWEHLALAAASGSPDEAAAEVGLEVAVELGGAPPPPPVTANRRAFRIMVRNAAFRRVELAARRDTAGLAALEQPGGLDATAWAQNLSRYFELHGEIGTGAAARGAAWFGLEETTVARGEVRGGRAGEAPGTGVRVWRVRQVLDDPEGDHDAAIVAEVDLAASDAAGEPAWRTIGLEIG